MDRSTPAHAIDGHSPYPPTQAYVELANEEARFRDALNALIGPKGTKIKRTSKYRPTDFGAFGFPAATAYDVPPGYFSTPPPGSAFASTGQGGGKGKGKGRGKKGGKGQGATATEEGGGAVPDVKVRFLVVFVLPLFFPGV